jgi:hypothetical protein
MLFFVGNDSSTPYSLLLLLLSVTGRRRSNNLGFRIVTSSTHNGHFTCYTERRKIMEEERR